jgi:NTP pyrophosphatase (non-canonical NTP hydrolase)
MEDLIDILNAVRMEVLSAQEKFPEFNSAHEGFSVLYEEVDELWDHVKVKQGRRNSEEMMKEAIQVAAMAVRFAHDICIKKRAQK